MKRCFVKTKTSMHADKNVVEGSRFTLKPPAVIRGLVAKLLHCLLKSSNIYPSLLSSLLVFHFRRIRLTI